MGQVSRYFNMIMSAVLGAFELEYNYIIFWHITADGDDVWRSV